MKAEDKIYKTYFDLQRDSIYFNQLKEQTRLSNSSLQNVLNKLISENILKQNKTKSNTFYKIKNKRIIALKFSEIAIEKFNELNVNVKTPLKNFLKNIPEEIGIIALFGSASRKEEKNGSDIDLLIISNKKIDFSKNKKEAELTSKYPLSIFQSTISQFLENKDDIIIQARKTGFPIYGEQKFYEVILNGS